MRKSSIALAMAAGAFALTIFAAPLPTAAAQDVAAARTSVESASTKWVWINSDQKYGKFFSPANVQVTAQVNGVATKIVAWTRTEYTPGGAQETITNYDISSVIDDPRKLAYSLALVEVHPQTREVVYLQEYFYNKSGDVLWSKLYQEPRTVKEINSQSFDEDFYVALVDQVFHHGERERQHAADRWIELWKTQAESGATAVSLADTTTMRLAFGNLIYWEWVETKDAAGSVVEVRFMKKALNASEGTERIIKGSAWTSSAGWSDMLPDGLYTAIHEDTPEAHGLKRLRAFIKGYQYWLNRYRTDSPEAHRNK